MVLTALTAMVLLLYKHTLGGFAVSEGPGPALLPLTGTSVIDERQIWCLLQFLV